MESVRTLGCQARGKGTPCHPKIEVHHKTGAGWALRDEHYQTMGLCFDHHSAQTSLPFGHAVHKGTKSFEANYGTQEEMIARCQLKILGYLKEPAPSKVFSRFKE